MWGGGFWGTPREDEWRRRKEKEDALASQIRNEEQRSRSDLVQRHEQEMQSKEHVLDLTRRMLQQSRVEETSIKRSALDLAGGTGGGEEDRKPSAPKKPRSEEQNAERGEVDTRDPDEIPSSSALKEEESESRKSLDSIRENLLGLSYAMFDSLFGTRSFEAKPFCEFLIKTGERSLAEQIALAAVEKSSGSKSDVHYVLFKLAAESSDADGLVERVTKILEGCNPNASEDGRRVLVQWQVKYGNKDAAFQAALKIPDEVRRFETAYPLLDGNAERRQQLKEACRSLCATEKIFPFSEEEWPDFVSFYASLSTEMRYLYGSIDCFVYLSFAASKMERQRGLEIGTIVVKDKAGKFIERAKDCWTSDLSGPSACKKSGDYITLLKSTRIDATKQVSEHLKKIDTMLFGCQRVAQASEALGMNRKNIILDVLESHVELSLPPHACKTAHRDAGSSYKCKACREQMFAAAWQIGLVLAIRQDSRIKDEPRVKAMGGDTLGSQEILKAELRKSGVHRDAVDVLVADAASLFEK